ncbi:MAG: TonB-dependent receptor [Thermomonas sp.]|uniref:TonB-dependent receptor domain-containing protein n=1 Tax=Thermomonas sp. TaxID=1971895 RepID=UPI0025F3E885|nr:TonB-dependent receptor [Thermomonas sp.]MBK6925051.1 TonB-dependent receptor [Thermomonas sp.]
MAAGMDLRREEFRFDGDQREVKRTVFNAPFDDANALGNVSRDIKAVYVEFRCRCSRPRPQPGRPLRRLQRVGGTTNPKVSFKYQPFSRCCSAAPTAPASRCRASTSCSTASAKCSTPASTCRPGDLPRWPCHPNVAGCEVIRPTELFGGKPDLQPEESTQKSFGLVYSPMGQFNIALDWWEIERENTIRSAPRDTLIQYYDLFEANWIRDAGGEVVSIDRRYINSGGSLMRGVELDANLNGELADGRWNVNLNGSYIHQFHTKALESLPYSSK